MGRLLGRASGINVCPSRFSNGPDQTRPSKNPNEQKMKTPPCGGAIIN
jgi:hypothetical protein